MNLRDQLHHKGWTIASTDGESSVAALIRVEAETIRWRITHLKRALEADLMFHLFGHFGGPTDDPANVLYCNAEGTELRLYFAKINTHRWRHESSAFVDALTYIEDGKSPG
jgi:hypothetical protein